MVQAVSTVPDMILRVIIINGINCVRLRTGLNNESIGFFCHIFISVFAVYAFFIIFLVNRHVIAENDRSCVFDLSVKTCSDNRDTFSV